MAGASARPANATRNGVAETKDTTMTAREDREAMPFPDPDVLTDDQLSSVCHRLDLLAEHWRQGLDIEDVEVQMMVSILESARGILRRRLDERLDAMLGEMR
jgi:hypothetical protein